MNLTDAVILHVVAGHEDRRRPDCRVCQAEVDEYRRATMTDAERVSTLNNLQQVAMHKA